MNGHLRRSVADRFAVVCAVGIAAVVHPATATSAEQAAPNSQAQAGELENIVVTARRREERQQDIPISMAVLSKEALQRQSLFSLRDIGNSVPNLDIRSHPAQGGNAPVIMLRGVGQLQADLPNDPGVGIYVDGIYMGRNQGVDFDLLDLEQVEVLRGPQGTLFGRNTTGGALNITTSRPVQRLEGSVGIAAGSFNRQDINAQINIPLGSTAAIRVSAASRQQDGYGHRLDFATGSRIGDEGSVDRIVARAQLAWTPNDVFDLRAAIDYAETDQDTAVRTVQRIYPPAGSVALANQFLNPPYDSRFVSPSPFSNYATGPSADYSRPYGGSLNLTWSLEDGGLESVKSLSSFRKLSTLNGTDPDGSPQLIIATTHDVEQEQRSQEFQFTGSSLANRLHWTGGLYYFWEDAHMVQDSAAFEVLYTNLNRDIGFETQPAQRTRSYAGYGQATYNLTDQWSITGGLRYTHEKKDVTRFTQGYFSHTITIPRNTLSDEWDAVTPRFDMQYRFSPELMVYASVAEGFRSGGFNSAPSSVLDTEPFDPEYLWTYESGVKSDLLDRRLRANLAVFVSDYRDMQFQVNSVTSIGTPIKLYENAGSASIKGFELELTAQALENLTFSMGAGYTDARYTNLSPASGVRPDSHFPNVPRWSANVSGEYEIQVGGYGQLSLRADYAWKSKILLIQQFIAPNNTPAQPDYGLLDARVTFRPSGGQWTLAAFGRNLTDERYLVAANDYGGLGFVSTLWGRPRELGLSLNYEF